MNIKKRIIIITILIIFITLVINITHSYEKRIISKKEITEVKNKYALFKEKENYKIENKERYISYYEKNKNLSFSTVITRVNIGLDKNFYSYIKDTNLEKNNLILVNKYQKLNKNYIPKNLEDINNKYFINANQNRKKLIKEARINFEKLSEDSIKNNTPVYGQSAYRDYETQKALYDEAVNNLGQLLAEKETARPGHSEHQTGLAIDVSSTKEGNMLEFEKTKSFKWMIENAHKYGFILRYQKNKEAIHGYIYEPWHYRYVGIKTATDIYNNYNNLTYDEYYYKFIDK